MKVELKEVENKGFKPFKIEIEVETLAELKELHNRLNLASYVINEQLDNNWCGDKSTLLFSFIDDKLEDSGVSYDS